MPARVTLRGREDGWAWTVVSECGRSGDERLPGTGTRWQAGVRRADPEPPWWTGHLAEVAEGLREMVGRRLTDRTFTELGVEAEISWFAVREPVEWEGLVTLRDPDPARFPGEVPPFLVTFQPGRGAVLPDDHLLFSTEAADVWTTLASIAERCGAPAPRARFLCGWAGHRAVQIGRGMLEASTEIDPDGVERLAQVSTWRTPGWAGNPELRPRLDGIDLLDEPAADVTGLFRELGHEVVERGPSVHVAAMGLYLTRPHDAPESFAFSGASLTFPRALADGLR
ncbi:hypothetical protein DZF91_06270 [Actinomadura logoneensis]|uniref:Uncharacterized protein n=1 Tax=Actinomadura logoneensis TaxID=2293572 RepID=A0A372JR37_9ACTN|nr:hypothetical protein [Actinomadura logoneensis]RFU42493.1 hypothetical protein DZF91_06270 [Actinomadura logoneensis]